MIKSFFLSPRMKSLYWRSAMMFLAGLVAITADSLDMFQLTPQAVAILGLVLGEISKALNNALEGKSLGFSIIK